MSLCLDTTKTLKLDASYRPLEVIDSIDALIMCIMDKAVAVESYRERTYTTYTSFEIPAVIVLKRVINVGFFSLNCTRMNIIWRDKNQCQYCGEKFLTKNLTMDHILPKSRGGLNTWTNLVASCKECNQKKGNKTPEESEMYPINIPHKPQGTLMKKIKQYKINAIWKEYLWE